MAARIYHRDQAGAPTLTYSTTVSAQAHFDAFRVVLKACLVSGFGSVPAAGWELIHDAANSLILRPASHAGYICFQRDSSALTVVTVWLAATYSGVDSAGKILGDGVRSGTAANNSVPHRFSVRSFAAYSASSTWALAADANTCTMSLSGFASATSIEVGSGSPGQLSDANVTMHFGIDSAGDMICVGGVCTAGAGATGAYAGFGGGGFTSLKYPDTGLLVSTGSIDVSMLGLGTLTVASGFGAYPAGLVVPEALLCPLTWSANGVMHQLRGISVDYRLAQLYNSQAAQALGGGVLTTRTMNTVITLSDGYQYLVARSYGAQAVSMLLTNNPEFWQ